MSRQEEILAEVERLESGFAPFINNDRDAATRREAEMQMTSSYLASSISRSIRNSTCRDSRTARDRGHIPVYHINYEDMQRRETIRRYRLCEAIRGVLEKLRASKKRCARLKEILPQIRADIPGQERKLQEAIKELNHDREVRSPDIAKNQIRHQESRKKLETETEKRNKQLKNLNSKKERLETLLKIKAEKSKGARYEFV